MSSGLFKFVVIGLLVVLVLAIFGDWGTDESADVHPPAETSASTPSVTSAPVAPLALGSEDPMDKDGYIFCLLTNRVAAAGGLKDYSNTQIENGLCMTSKAMLFAVTMDDAAKLESCTRAAEEMMGEFKKRFPNRQANEVIGKC